LVGGDTGLLLVLLACGNGHTQLGGLHWIEDFRAGGPSLDRNL
jgi:hypothetical protein